MAYAVGVIIAVVVILASIALHEVGHMVPAKKFGVRVSQYMVGFGPTVWSKTKGETEYGLKWIPLGGYVRLVGMYPTDEAVGAKKPTTWAGRAAADARAASAEEIHPGEDGRAFYRLSVPKKLVVMFSGPVTNLVIAVVLMGIAMVGIGFPTMTSTVSTVSDCVLTGTQTTCAHGAAQAPARAAGLRAGDRIVSWDGHQVSTWDQTSAAIWGSSGKVPVVIERDGHRSTLTVDVAQVERQVADANGNPVTRRVGYAGITPAQALVRQPVWDVPSQVGSMAWQTAGVVLELPKRVWDVAAQTFSGQQRGTNTVMSIVGIGRVAGETATVEGQGIDTATRAVVLLNILAALNVSLFVFNMIPLPPLDGGHIVAALWEGARRQVSRWRGKVRTRPADSARLVPVGYAVFVLFAVMGVLLVWADIVNPVRLA